MLFPFTLRNSLKLSLSRIFSRLSTKSIRQEGPKILLVDYITHLGQVQLLVVWVEGWEHRHAAPVEKQFIEDSTSVLY